MLSVAIEHTEPGAPRRRRGPATAAALAWIVTFVAYMVGSQRAYDYDSAETMHLFVRTESSSDAFTRQVYFNNHPIFSFLEHLVYSVTGSVAETTMRVLPVACSATVVAVLVWWCTRRWGALAGACGGLVLASHPLLTHTGREVRGYSLMLLMAVMVGLIAITPGPATSRRRVCFAAAAAVGIGTHLYMVMPVSLAVVWMVLTGRWDRDSSMWLGLGGLGGLACYLGMSDFGRAGRWWRPSFPADLTWVLLGGTVVSVTLWVVLALLVLPRSRGRIDHQRAALAVTVVVVAFVALVWLVAPSDLFPRFFLWLVPLLAAGVAWAVGQRPRLALVAGAAVLATLAPQVPRWDDDVLPNRDLAAVAAELPTTCGVDHRVGGYAFYDPDVRRIRLDDRDERVLERCDAIVFLVPPLASDLMSEVEPAFPTRCDVRSDQIDGALLVPRGSTCPNGTIRHVG